MLDTGHAVLMTADQILLDTRDMAPPEPYELATDALDNLQHGKFLCLVISRRPLLLYPWVEEHGFCEITKQSNDDTFEVYIWHCNDTKTGDDVRRLTG